MSSVLYVGGDNAAPAAALADKLEARGFTCRVCSPFKPLPDFPRPELLCGPEKTLEGAELMLCLGGDGTIMHTVRRIAPHEVPVIGVKANGSRRWLGVGSFTVQPSELAKLAVILCFSVLICRFGEKMKTFRYGILPFLGILGAMVGLLILEPHFSASVILLLLGGAMLFLGGVKLGWFGAALGGLGAGLAVLLTFFPYASSRIVT